MSVAKIKLNFVHYLRLRSQVYGNWNNFKNNLNNIEKILRIKKGNVKPGGKPELQNDLINNARDFLGGR